MDLNLAGKRALVTGSSSGIGAAIALELAAEGASVVVHGRDEAKSLEIATRVKAHGAQAAIALGDLTTDTGAAIVADRAVAAFGGIDILVNSAGGMVRGDNPHWLEVTAQDWIDTYNLNLLSMIRLTQRLSPAMCERGWGRIINISSIGGSRHSGMMAEYGAAKSALDHASGNLSKDLAPKGVTVNVVIPGTVMTPLVEKWIIQLRRKNGWPDDLSENERRYTREAAPQPVPRLGRPEDIAAAVAFLASPRSDYTTGASLRIDGGALWGR